MASLLKGFENWQITGSFKTSVTVDEITEYVLENGGGGEGGGVTQEYVDAQIANLQDSKVEQSQFDTVIDLKADKSSVYTKAQTDAAVKVVADDAEAMELDIGTLKTTQSAQGATQTAQAASIAKLQTDKADKTSLTKAGVGLGNVDNTADAAKPVSTAQKAALDLKVNLAGIHKTYNETLPVQFAAANVDVNTIDYGESYIQTDTAVNAPPNTMATLIQKIKTHSSASMVFPFTDIPDDAWEQGTVSNGSAAGFDRDYITSLENVLAVSRVRTKTLIPITELGNIKLTNIDGDFRMYMSFFGENKLTMGSEIDWTNGTRIAPPNARYAQIVVRRANSANITPEEVFGKFKVSTSANDVIKGEGSLEIAWGATKGDLHTRVVVKNGTEVAYGGWKEIGSKVPDPKDLPDGSTLVVRGGQWVVELPAEPVR